MNSKSLTQGGCSRINVGSGNRTSAPVQALDHKSNSIPLGYHTLMIHSFNNEEIREEEKMKVIEREKKKEEKKKQIVLECSVLEYKSCGLLTIEKIFHVLYLIMHSRYKIINE